MRLFLTFVLLCSTAMAEQKPLFTQAESDAVYASLLEGLNLCRKNYAPRTHAFCAVPPEEIPSVERIQDLDPNPVGYGSGIDDCALYLGTLMVGVLDLYDLTHDPRLVELARDNGFGMMMMGDAHGVKGYVTRGLSPVDAKSTYITSSRDQYTHYVEALWKYYHSPLSETGSTREEIRRLLAAVADAMAEQVTEENDWSMLRSDGTKDPRGLHKMWYVYAHEAARLPMIYAAAWDVTGEEKYRELYEKYIDEAIAQSRELKTKPLFEVNAWVPTYSFYQMQCSLELLYNVEKNPVRQAEILRAIQETKEFANIRFSWLEKKGGLREFAEILSSQTILPQLEPTDLERQYLEKTFRNPHIARSGVGGVTHLFRLYALACRNGAMPLPKGDDGVKITLPYGEAYAFNGQWQDVPARKEVNEHQVVFLSGETDTPENIDRMAQTCEKILALRPRPAGVIFLKPSIPENVTSLFQKFIAAGIPVRVLDGSTLSLPRADFLLGAMPEKDGEKPFFVIIEKQTSLDSLKAFTNCKGVIDASLPQHTRFSKETPRVKGVQRCNGPLDPRRQGFTYVQLDQWEFVFRPVTFNEMDVWARMSDVIRLRQPQ